MKGLCMLVALSARPYQCTLLLIPSSVPWAQLQCCSQGRECIYKFALACKSTLDVYTPSSSTDNPTTMPHALKVTLEINGISIPIY